MKKLSRVKNIFAGIIAACVGLTTFAQQNPNAGYQPPFFADKERAAKVKALPPVIQSMYSNYAKEIGRAHV